MPSSAAVGRHHDWGLHGAGPLAAPLLLLCSSPFAHHNSSTTVSLTKDSVAALYLPLADAATAGHVLVGSVAKEVRWTWGARSTSRACGSSRSSRASLQRVSPLVPHPSSCQGPTCGAADNYISCLPSPLTSYIDSAALEQLLAEAEGLRTLPPATDSISNTVYHQHIPHTRTSVMALHHTRHLMPRSERIILTYAPATSTLRVVNRESCTTETDPRIVKG